MDRIQHFRAIQNSYGMSSKKEVELEKLKRFVSRHFKDTSAFEEDTLVNGISQHLIVMKYKDDESIKKIIAYPNETFNTGQIVDCFDIKWLITKVDANQQIYTMGQMTLCNNIIKLSNNTSTIDIPCIISNSITSNSEQTKYFRVPDNQVLCTVSNNIDTQLIELSQIYKIGRQNYEVVGIDDITIVGMLILTMQFTLKEQEVLEETENTSSSIVLTINGNNTIHNGTSEVYVASVTQNGTVLTNKSVIFELFNQDESNNVYTSIISQDGISAEIIAGSSIGKYVNLVCKLVDDNTIVAENTIQIVGLF